MVYIIHTNFFMLNKRIILNILFFTLKNNQHSLLLLVVKKLEK